MSDSLHNARGGAQPDAPARAGALPYDTARPRVQEAPSADGQAWDAFVRQLGWPASFYHLHAWRDINEDYLGHRCHYLTARTQEGIAGVLPLVHIRSRLFGRILCSMPFLNFGGPCASTPAAERALLDHAKGLAASHRVDYLEVRSPHPLQGFQHVSDRKVSMTLLLDQDAERIWSGFKSKHRTNIRRVYKDGFHVRSGGHELLSDFYDVLSRNWHALGTPIYARGFFARVLDTFPDHTRIFVAYRSGRPAAAALNGYFAGTVEGMWAGSHPDARALQPNYVLYWEMIRHACEAGLERYHFGRSTAGSPQEAFKRKWNTEPLPLYWHYELPSGGTMPGLNVDNPRYQRAIRLWQRLPVGLTRLLGPPLARSIP